MNIGDILTKAWQIVWKHKVLWIFGILASCVEGGGGGGNSGGGGSGNGGGSSFNPEDLGLPVEGWVQDLAFFLRNLETHPEQYVGLFAVILLVLCILWVVFVMLGTMGRIGLVNGALQADSGAESLSFGEIWQSSMPYFWRVLLMWLGLWLVGFVVGVVFAVILLAGTALTFGLGLLCLLPLLCLLIPLAWLTGAIFQQATIAIVKENLGIADALTRAWNLVRANIGQYVLLAFILFLIELVIGFIFIIPILLMAAPFIFGLGTGLIEDIRTTLLIFGLCFVVYIPVLIVLGGIMRAYVWTAWTLTFNRLSDRPVIETAAPEKLDAY